MEMRRVFISPACVFSVGMAAVRVKSVKLVSDACCTDLPPSPPSAPPSLKLTSNEQFWRVRFHTPTRAQDD